MKRLFVANRILMGAALAVACAGARLAVADDLPKPETILDKSVEATGGKAAYQKIHTEISTGSMEIQGMKGTATTYKAEPDKVYTEINFEGIGKMQEGSNGTVAWSNSAIQGPHVKEGEERDMAFLMARMDAEVNWRDLFPKVETAGVENVEGKDCYKVVMTPKSGKPITRFYDKQTGLMVKQIMTVKTPMGELTVESIGSDYRKDGDILSPHKLTNRTMGQEFSIIIDKVEYNAEIPPSKFDVPAEVQALIKK